MKGQILALAALGIALEALGLVDWTRALDWALANAAGWTVPAAIALAQLVLYTFGQPGSIHFWPAALLYPPPLATLILTAGALGASLMSLPTSSAAAARRATRIVPLGARREAACRTD